MGGGQRGGEDSELELRGTAFAYSVMGRRIDPSWWTH